MSIYSRVDLLAAEQEGKLRIPLRRDFNPFSLDLRLGSLYRRRHEKIAGADTENLSQEQFIAEFCEEVLVGNGLTVYPSDFYLWQPVEEIFLAEGLGGEIVSRSSWARLGSRVSSSSDDLLRSYHRSVQGRPLCTLRTTGTHLSLQQGDALAQLVINDAPSFCLEGEVASLLQEGRVMVRREGKTLFPQEAVAGNGILLTMGPDLAVYRGGVVRPGNALENHFEWRHLCPKELKYFSQGTFFISASAEEVEISPKYVGFVVEREPETFLLPFAAHANAPYIGPRGVFQGKITFENVMIRDGYLSAGMSQSRLLLCPLRTPLLDTKESRYNHQGGATLSKGT